MVLYGTTHRIGDGITTAHIIAPANRTDDPAQLAAHCLAAIDPSLAEHVAEGDMLLVGNDFGAGEDAEIAVLALQALGIAAIICSSAAPLFVAVAEPYGMPVLIVPNAAEIPPGVTIRVDLERSAITDRTHGVQYQFEPCSPVLIAAVRRAQLLNRMRRVVEDEGFDG